MKYYEVQMMTEDDYNAYMCGSNEYHCQTVTVAAESAEQAVSIVKMHNPNMMVNTHPQEVAPKGWL
jgi:hypothetical protein